MGLQEPRRPPGLCHPVWMNAVIMGGAQPSGGGCIQAPSPLPLPVMPSARLCQKQALTRCALISDFPASTAMSQTLLLLINNPVCGTPWDITGRRRPREGLGWSLGFLPSRSASALPDSRRQSPREAPCPPDGGTQVTCQVLCKRTADLTLPQALAGRGGALL